MWWLLPRDRASHPDFILGEHSVPRFFPLGALVEALALFKAVFNFFKIVLAGLSCIIWLSYWSAIDFCGRSSQEVFMFCELVHPRVVILGYPKFEESQLEKVEKASSKFHSLVYQQDQSDSEQGLVEVLF